MVKKILIPVILLLGIVFGIQAAENDNLNWSVDCDGFTSVGGGIILDRDNTGEGSEAFIIRATDGVGNVIFGPFVEESFVGSGVYVTPGTSLSWSITPVANPLTVTVTSAAGNGQAAQTIYTVTGTCAEIGTADEPTPAPTTQMDEIAFDEGVIELSPSVPLNGSVPTSTNMTSFRNTGASYLIVDRVTANLRSGDGSEYTIVGRVGGSTELLPIGRNADRSWWLVEVGTLRGWINGELVLIVGDLTDVPEVEAVGEIFPPRFYVYITQRIFVEPRENSPVLCTIGGDLEYIIAGQDADGQWIAIETECNGGPVVGWISSENGAIRNSGDLPIPVIAR